MPIAINSAKTQLLYIYICKKHFHNIHGFRNQHVVVHMYRTNTNVLIFMKRLIVYDMYEIKRQ